MKNGEKQKARPKEVNLKVRSRTKFAVRCWSENSALLYWRETEARNGDRE